MQNKIFDELHNLKLKSIFIIESAFVYNNIDKNNTKSLANIITNDIAKEFDKILNNISNTN